MKRTVLNDLASMLRSFDYVAWHCLREKVVRVEDRLKLEVPFKEWIRWMCSEFLKGYSSAIGDRALLPRDPAVRQSLTHLFMLEKALHEINYELGRRPHWVSVPLKGTLELLAG